MSTKLKAKADLNEMGCAATAASRQASRSDQCRHATGQGESIVFINILQKHRALVIGPALACDLMLPGKGKTQIFGKGIAAAETVLQVTVPDIGKAAV